MKGQFDWVKQPYYYLHNDVYQVDRLDLLVLF